ncbi:MAG: AAA family ATPase [Peptostreptococcaceae bacterium]|nr:AAA family ATPase [Peptostreptococcaceae bacterium]
MYAVITSPEFFKEIEQVVSSKGEEILLKKIDVDIDINEEIERVSRIAVKHLIIDITSLENEGKLVQAIRRYRIKKANTQIIIIAPNYKPGNETLSLLVTMGVYDIIAPEKDQEEELNISPLLLNVLDNPTQYARAVKWDIGAMTKKEDDEGTEKTVEKIRIQKEYVDVVESVFKKVITVYSPTGEGSSCIAAHLAHAIASNKKCKVLLIDYNPLKPCQREIFNMKVDYTLKDAIESSIRRTLSNVALESYTKESKYNKNLSILSGTYDINDFYDTKDIEIYEEIIEKAKFSYDYVVIDTHSFYDIYSTDAALRLADEVLIPVRGKGSSIDTLNRYLDMFGRYNDFDIRKFKTIINKYSANDLTFIEIESKLKTEILGYISDFKDYDKSNGFKNNKLMAQYTPILNKIGIRVNKNKSLLNILNKILRR